MYLNSLSSFTDQSWLNSWNWQHYWCLLHNWCRLYSWRWLFNWCWPLYQSWLNGWGWLPCLSWRHGNLLWWENTSLPTKLSSTDLLLPCLTLNWARLNPPNIKQSSTDLLLPCLLISRTLTLLYLWLCCCS